jgi:hypothetical protein
MLLDDILDPLLLEVLVLIFLHIEANLGTTTNRRIDSVEGDSESAASR